MGERFRCMLRNSWFNMNCVWRGAFICICILTVPSWCKANIILTINQVLQFGAVITLNILKEYYAGYTLLLIQGVSQPVLVRCLSISPHCWEWYVSSPFCSCTFCEKYFFVRKKLVNAILITELGSIYRMFKSVKYS